MTDELDLAPIRQRLAAATEGPWNVDANQDSGNALVAAPGMPVCGTGWGEQALSDADLIAHAPTDLAALCDEVERLHSWDGLLSLLDEHWPEDIFPTKDDDPGRDPGPRVVSLLRALDAEKNRADAAEAAIARVRELIDVWRSRAKEIAITEDGALPYGIRRGYNIAADRKAAMAKAWDEGYDEGWGHDDYQSTAGRMNPYEATDD